MDTKDVKKKPDRVLGDEWENWTGDLDESLTYEETAGLFTLYAGLTLLFLLAGLAFIVYMVEPRLHNIHPALAYMAWIFIIAVILSTTVWCGLVAGSVFTGKNLVVRGRLGQVTATTILPFVLALGRRMGISRDRLGNSFVYFSNAIVKASYKPGKGTPIILLPRCLTPELKSRIKELAARAGVKVFTSGGGEQARRIIREQRPSAVIGVACERDLLSGIRDVAPKMPTIGVTNKRPDGPCKNTLVDMKELKNAIETLTGISFD
ncbi:DUF116 domain-containing protein [Candidatus Latescibacterota bacterium]